MGHFHPLEVVGRGSETQLQVRENSNYLIWRCEGSTEVTNNNMGISAF